MGRPITHLGRPVARELGPSTVILGHLFLNLTAGPVASDRPVPHFSVACDTMHRLGRNGRQRTRVGFQEEHFTAGYRG
jgi:hypothetical protein